MRQRKTRGSCLQAIFLFCLMILMSPADSVEAACGASASSCKNCHEVKGEMRVNTKGDYHTQHAFGDFCVFCHSGNTASTTKAEAHQGMVKPLENLQQSCASCHPDDYEKRATGYGAVIRPKGSAGGGGPAGTAPDATKTGELKPSGSASVSGADNALPDDGSPYAILAPTPDPAAVRPEDLIDYNLYWIARDKWALPGTVGDRILVGLSIMLLMGFPLLHRIFGEKKRGRPKLKISHSASVDKGAMDKGLA